LQKDSPVNLERAYALTVASAGHFVQGHVDYVAAIIAFDTEGPDFDWKSRVAGKLQAYVASRVRSPSMESV